MNKCIDVSSKNKCNGCGVCALRCPVNAIEMKEDYEGFLYPEINKEKCINCSLCKKICSNKHEKNEYQAKTYVSYCNNKEDKQRSSSGGMFYSIAKYVIEQNGVVFGVTYDDKLKVVHDYAQTLEECKKFQGSKYVRSDVKESYKNVEKFLEEARIVLFTGTPCQCNGLRKYLMKDYENLITCEIVCHANPSPKVFEMYKQNLEKRHKKSIRNITFRSKCAGWKNSDIIIEFDTGEPVADKSYYVSFVSELINRTSCHYCAFSDYKNRLSDFTIGDFWGIDKVDKDVIDDDTGISLLNVNTEKGEKILDELKENLFLKQVKTEDAFKYNHNGNVPAHKNRDEFFDGIKSGKINSSNIIDYMDKYTSLSFFDKCKRKIKTIIKKVLKTIKFNR